MKPYEKVSEFFEILGAPARLGIISEIGAGEACVCHLEAVLGLRQAYISQQLMVLREKDLIVARREGKYVYYSLRQPEILELIAYAARISGEPEGLPKTNSSSSCECPICAQSQESSQIHQNDVVVKE
jgi:ArsR family transcriptional regulator